MKKTPCIMYTYSVHIHLISTSLLSSVYVVHCREEGCIALYNPDNQEISRGPKDFQSAKPEGNLGGHLIIPNTHHCHTQISPIKYQEEEMVVKNVCLFGEQASGGQPWAICSTNSAELGSD